MAAVVYAMYPDATLKLLPVAIGFISLNRQKRKMLVLRQEDYVANEEGCKSTELTTSS